MAKPDVWMPLYVADYLADTSHLTVTEHGAYLLLIMHYWRNCGLPADEGKLARIVKCTAKEWAQIRDTIAEFFDEDWSHKRIDEELASARASIERNRINGRKGGRPKKGNPPGNPEETHRVTQTEPSGYPKHNPPGNPNHNPNERPSPSPSPSERKNQLDLSSAAIPDTARAVEPPAAPPPGFDPRFRDVQIRVQALLNSPALTSFGLVDKWLKAGAEPEIDIYPTLQGRRDRWNGRTLAYFDEAVLDAVKTRTTPAGTNAASISLPPYSEAERGEKQWVFRVKSFREHGTWLDQWGPTPDEPGCRAPASARAA
jgi:uncharacterized protein YdaU (DUF1376 family)